MNDVARASVCVLRGLCGSRVSGLWGQLVAGRVCGVQKGKWEAVWAGTSRPCPCPFPVPSSLRVPTEDSPTTRLWPLLAPASQHGALWAQAPEAPLPQPSRALLRLRAGLESTQQRVSTYGLRVRPRSPSTSPGPCTPGWTHLGVGSLPACPASPASPWWPLSPHAFPRGEPPPGPPQASAPPTLAHRLPLCGLSTIWTPAAPTQTALPYAGLPRPWAPLHVCESEACT